MASSVNTKICLKDNGCDEAELSFLVGAEYKTVSSFDFQDDAYLSAEKLYSLIADYIKSEGLSENVGVTLSENGRVFSLAAGDVAGVPTEVVEVEDIGDLCDMYEASEVLLRIFNILNK
ncbi:hypothetical protein [Photobacterium damselae]|uniref:hypothetical protein n=1 Tax=Photobacterium damselae TaxID=38293 RepID=UPI001F43DD9C|nr:hypothetical protein [Photobacterium damselae]UKA04499.1 hypothetical protein IHC89_23030 [Photobacterium damselae subsp. damselae]